MTQIIKDQPDYRLAKCCANCARSMLDYETDNLVCDDGFVVCQVFVCKYFKWIQSGDENGIQKEND